MKTEQIAEKIRKYINSDLHVEDGEYTDKTIHDAVVFGYELCNTEWQEKWDTSINFDKQVIAESAAEQAWKECNAEWQEKVRWKDARKEPATKFNKWIEFSCGKGIDNHRFIVFIESKTHFKFYFKYHPNELLWREIIE